NRGQVQLLVTDNVQWPRSPPRPCHRGRRGRSRLEIRPGGDCEAQPSHDGRHSVMPKGVEQSNPRFLCRNGRVPKSEMPKGVEHRSVSSLSAPQQQAQLLWSLTTAGTVRGLCLAREKAWLLVRDENDWLYLLDRNGERQGQVRAPKELTACACAEDGSAFVTASRDGDLW